MRTVQANNDKEAQEQLPLEPVVFKLSFPTSELLNLFGLPSLDLDPGELYMDYWPDDGEATEVAEQWLDMDEEDIEKALEKNPEFMHDIKRAIVDAMGLGYMGRYYERVKDALEEMLTTFSDYDYEFYSEGGGQTYSGHAQGIIPESIVVGYDTTTFEANSDLARIVQDNVAGYGMFDVDSEYEGETPEEYAKSRFHWLEKHWEIYGDIKPKPDLDRIDEFDDAYFRERLEEIKTGL